MKNLLQRFLQKNLNRLTWILVLAAFGFFGSPVGAQIMGTSPASRCGEGQLVLHATASSGIITWYSVPFYGTSVATGGTFTTPSLVVTTTYYVDAVDENGCSLNPGSVRVPVIATISANSIQATIFYESSTFCASVTEPQLPTRTGTAGGTYTADPVTGLDLDPSTGAIIPSESANGTYTVTYTVIPAEGCIENPASTTVTITNAPEQPTISYTGNGPSPYCTTHTPLAVTQTGATGGSYSASPSGLSIHAGTGTITPSNSLAGTYTITYFIAGTGGCSPMSATATLAITAAPAASISYAGNPFCVSVASAQPVTLLGSGAYTGGEYTYSGTGTLSLNSGTGAVTPSTSNPGSYTVTYTIPASGGCSSVPVTTGVTVNPLPNASISGTTSVCQGTSAPNITFTGSNGTPPYTFTYDVNSGTDLTVSTTGGSSTVTVAQSTVSAGSFEYTLLSVSDAHGCSHTVSGTATITVVSSPVATFTYSGSPYCQVGTALPSFTGGGTAGTFSSTAGLVFVSTSTGEIDLAASTPGTYTVTNTISSCGGVSSTADITINALPTATLTGTLEACVTTTLTANTDAGSPAYEWYKDNVLLPGENSATLVVTVSGGYKVKVTNTTTGCSKYSSASTVTIHPLPVVSISGADMACVSTVLTAVNDAVSPSFIWYKDDEVMVGETEATLTVVTSGNYKVQVTDGVTGCSFTTNNLTVTINPLPSATIAGTITVCLNATSPDVTFTGADGTSPYTFTYNINGGSDLTVMTAVGESTVTVAAPTGTDGEYVYTLTKVVDGSITACEKTITGQSATITVRPGFTPGAIQTTGQTICYNTIPGSIGSEADAEGGDEAITYKWQSSVSGTFSDAIDIASNTASLTFSGGLTTTTTFRRLAHDGTCNTGWEISTGTWTVTVYNNFTAGAIETTGETICYGADPSLIGSSIAAGGGDESITYEWKSSADGYTNSIEGANEATFDPPSLKATTSFRRYAKDGTCESFTQSTGTWTVTVYNEFNVGSIATTGQTICYAGTPTEIGSTTAASGGDENISYSWRSSADGFTDPIAGAEAATYTPPDGLTITTTYSRYAKDGTCASFEGSIGAWTVTVHPQFDAGSILITGQTICSGTVPATIGNDEEATGGHGTISYKWQSSVLGTFTDAVDILSNTTSLSFESALYTTTTYRRLAKNEDCNDFTISSGTWQVVVNELPTAGITPSDPTSFCSGGSINLTASGGTSYEWSTSSTEATIEVDAGGTYTVTVTDENGCTDTEEILITVWTLPTAVITPSGPTSFCDGGSVDLTGSGGLSYEWSTSSTDATITVSVGDIYTLTVTDANGCTDTKEQTVTIWDLPMAEINASGATSFCEGGSVQLTAVGGVSYKWSTNSTNATITVTEGGTYTVTVTDVHGCTDTEEQETTVWTLPTATISPSGSTSFCSGGSVDLFASGGDFYHWNTSDINDFITVTSGGTYSVTVTDYNGCSDAEEINITVWELPTAVITPSGPTTFCQGGSVNLTASGGSSYYWSTDASTAQIVVTESGTYTVTVTDTHGCTDTEEQVVTVNDLPTAVITPSGPTTFCDGGSVDLTASGGTSYVWSTSSTNATITVGASGTYTVTVTDGNGCSNTEFQEVTAYPAFSAGAIATDGESITTGGSPTVTIGNVTGASGGDGTISYEWRSSADGYSTAISGATGSSFLPTDVLTETTTYKRYAKDDTCTTMIASTGEWTVTVAPDAPTGTSPQTFCH